MPPARLAPSPSVIASPRVRLARLALYAASAVPDVLGVEAGSHGMRVTADPPAGLLRGVSVIAEADGRYAVDLCLAAAVVPLLPLGEEVRRRVHASARRDGLAHRLGTVSVEFARLVTAEEAQREAEAEAARSETAVAPAGPPDEETDR